MALSGRRLRYPRQKKKLSCTSNCSTSRRVTSGNHTTVRPAPHIFLPPMSKRPRRKRRPNRQVGKKSDRDLGLPEEDEFLNAPSQPGRTACVWRRSSGRRCGPRPVITACSAAACGVRFAPLTTATRERNIGGGSARTACNGICVGGVDVGVVISVRSVSGCDLSRL